jgi:hypothetical protein
MKIKSAKSFRFWYKTKVKHIEKDSKNYDEDFVGVYHDENGKKIKGFFEMYHGDKPDIATYLPSILKIAEDGQAIYEFLQNAVDSNSTHFYIFYNDKYFLAINNGETFDIEGLKSVLNIAQTTKKSCDKIGRFGIGFKLVHRLVGKNEGVNELVKQYKGPILFSWSRWQDLQALMNNEKIEPIFPNPKDPQKNKDFFDAPYLFKIILTNFPTEPNEQLKDLNYQNKILFTQEELNELVRFLNESLSQHSDSVKANVLKQGTLFFLRLGEGKKQLLDRDYQDLKTGVQYSMNLLKRLQKVYINGEEISRQTLELEEFEIDKNSKEFQEISPEYKDCNIKIAFGYYKDYKKSENIKQSPNFYKYFPMGDETNGFSFILHCDAFSNEANRRKLQKDNTNKNLLPVIAQRIISKLNTYKNTNREQFLRLYASLLLSDIPNKQNNEWLKPVFYDILLDYLRKNIPTQNKQYANNSEHVKIKKVNLNLDLSDFGLDHIQWFEWEEENDNQLTIEATKSKKLGIQIWDIRDIIENADLNCMNEWIYNSNVKEYKLFLNELEKSDLRKATKSRLMEIALFKFSDGYFYSVSDLSNTDELIFNTKKTIKIKSELQKLGFVTSDFDVSTYENIYSVISKKLPTDKELFKSIASSCEENELTAKEKQKLFLNFIQEETKFENIAEGTLGKLCLFCNNEGEVKPLCELVDSALSTPHWLNSYKIKAEENFPALKKYLISEEEIYQEVILPNWQSILTEVKNISDFYEKVKFYYTLNERNTPLKKENFVFVNEIGFIPASEVFYNSKFTKINAYKDFESAVMALIDTHIPQKNILTYLNEPPFEVKSKNLFDFTINDGTELDKQEILAVLEFCKLNNENFFDHCVIEKYGQNYLVSRKSKGVYQVRPPKKEVKEFIEQNLDDTFKILPYELDEYKDGKGILQGEGLYEAIINQINVEDYKEELVNILAYDEPKRMFLLKLSEVRLVVGEKYVKENFEYKVLEMACNVLSESDYEKFRKKIIIETETEELKLNQIPPFADKIKIDEYELRLAKILPENYQNSDFLSDLIQNFVKAGINKEKINNLLDINQEPELSDILALLSDTTSTLQTAEQLAFLILYNEHVERVNFEDFKVETLDGEYDINEYSYYTREHNFILSNAILSGKYNGIERIFKEFPVSINPDKETFLLKSPFFKEDKFFCPDIETEMSDEQKLSFIEFLYHQWDKKNKKIAIKNIDWSTINEIETKNLLGFNPNYSVYPSEYALESEQLPEYLQEWLGEDTSKISFIADLGVFTENSTLLALRKFFKEKGTFNKIKIAQDSHFNDETMLFNTFEWLKENEIELSNEEEFEVFEEMVRVINANPASNNQLNIEEEFDFEILENESEEWEAPHYEKWKEELEDKYTIYLFQDELPKIIKLDKIEDYIFYRYHEGDVAIDENNNIYLNKNVDIQKALTALISDENNEFSAQDLLVLYQTKENVSITQDYKVEELLSEIERLRERVAQLEGVSGRASYDATVSYDEAYHHEIKEKSEKYLYEILKKQYPKHTVKWLNYNDKTETFEESWQNHDFEIIDRNGNILHYIDCKGTPQSKRTFYLTDNEWRFFLSCVQKGQNYQIYRIFNVSSDTYYVYIDNLWEWIKQGKVVPYLIATEQIRGGRVFLTLL